VWRVRRRGEQDDRAVRVQRRSTAPGPVFAPALGDGGEDALLELCVCVNDDAVGIHDQRRE
jgi:hypothetical protein